MKIKGVGTDLLYTSLAIVIALVRSTIGRPVLQRDRRWEVTLPATDGIEICTWVKVS